MSVETQSFTRLLPKETRFIVGENPSASKLNGSFAQIENAFLVLESFLGNGIDYHITNNDNRKFISNISSAIGRTDKLYKPINMLPSLEFIDNVWGYDATSFSDNILTFVTNLLSVGIAVNAKAGYELGIFYTGDGQVMGVGADINAWSSLGSTGADVWKWKTFNIANNISFFKIKANTDNGLKIKSMYVVNKSLYNGVYNKAYCIPFDNASFWVMKTPCKYANPTSINPCVVKTCNYCIGQTYDFDSLSPTYGQPKCVSYDSDSVSGARWMNSGNPISISYEAEPLTINGSPNERGSFLTVQSPILTIDNQYAIRFKPYHIHNETIDTQLTTNLNMIYDTKNSSSTIKYLTALFSAGGSGSNIRGDILYIKDTDEVSSGIGDQNRFLIVGGNYGLIDLMYDIMKFISIPVPVDASDHVAVYSG